MVSKHMHRSRRSNLLRCSIPFWKPCKSIDGFEFDPLQYFATYDESVESTRRPRSIGLFLLTMFLDTSTLHTEIPMFAGALALSKLS